MKAIDKLKFFTSDRQQFILWILLLSIAFILSFPSGILISDELSYLSLSQLQLVQLGLGKTGNDILNFRYQDYVLGFPFILMLVHWVLGLKFVYLINFCFLILSVYLIRSILRKLNLDSNWAYSLLFFLPVVLFSRLLMSELTSLFIVCCFLYFMMVKEKRIADFFLLGLLFSISFWVKESTIILLAPMLLVAMLNNLRGAAYLILGLAVGILPFVLTNLQIYGTLMFRDTGAIFGVDLLASNSLFLVYIFFMLFPASILIIRKAKIPLKTPIVLGLFLYSLLHLFYQYNGWQESGLKSLLLYPRYFICTTPFIILFFSNFFRKKSFNYFPIMSALVFYLMSFGGKYLENQYRKVTEIVTKHVSHQKLNVSYSLNEISKVISPFGKDIILGKMNIESWEKVPNGEYYLGINRTDTKIWQNQLIALPRIAAIDSITIFNHIEYKLYKK